MFSPSSPPNSQANTSPSRSVAKQVASARFGPNAKPRNDMLGSFVRHGLTQAETESEALLQIMVGTDSTATAVRCIFYYIITSPRIHARLISELDSALAAGELTRPILRDAESKSLPYLQACITEGLRIWPPVASLIYKKSPPGGDRLDDGRFIPGGTNVGYSAWAVHRDRRMYGADAHVYRPERWLEAKGEKREAMGRSVELVFGTGRYGCLGKGIAALELNKVFAEVCFFFFFFSLSPLSLFRFPFPFSPFFPSFLSLSFSILLFAITALPSPIF